MTKLEKIMKFIECFAFCPCCQQTHKCADDCTYADDAYTDYDAYIKMVKAREVLEDD